MLGLAGQTTMTTRDSGSGPAPASDLRQAVTSPAEAARSLRGETRGGRTGSWPGYRLPRSSGIEKWGSLLLASMKIIMLKSRRNP